MSKQTDSIRLEIKKHLSNCDGMPHVCAQITTLEGYRRIEDTIISIMIEQKIGIGAAIAIIESDRL